MKRKGIYTLIIVALLQFMFYTNVLAVPTSHAFTDTYTSYGLGDLDIQNAIVTANIDGIVNVINDIYPGDFLSSGEEILTIIPENNTAYTMQVYVSNKDIGELKVGDSVKYNFAALPSKEYGEMRGTITSISEDALSNQSSGQSYYIVEATVPDTKLFSHDGKQGDIKVGMICEANIITQQKSIIRFLLEKIDLLD